MWPPAQVGERPVGVERHGLDPALGDEVVDKLDLVVLSLGDKARASLLDGDVLAHEQLGGTYMGAHTLLDGREVSLRGRVVAGELKVVVEASVHRGPDRDLGVGVEVEHGGREHVSGVVADERQRLGA